MKLIQLEKINIQSVFIIVFVQTIFLSHSAYGQFHWGSNSRPALARLRALVQQQLRTPGHFYYVQKPKSDSNEGQYANSLLDDTVSIVLQSRQRRGAKPYIMRCHSLGPMSMLRRCVWEVSAPKIRRFFGKSN